jgi:hypothetical protein
MGSIEIREIEAPESSGPMSEVGVQNWVLVAEVDKVAKRAVVFPWVPQPVWAPLFYLYTWKLWPP